jgi:5-carboxymethyl-2-hydroxymuconate isomerase
VSEFYDAARAIRFFVVSWSAAICARVEEGMPHIIVEYSSNLRESLRPELFIQEVHNAAVKTGAFGASTLRTRASERTCYRVGDGHPENGFVHIVMRIRPGRGREEKLKLGESIFSVICDYLKPIFDSRPLGLTYEIQEIDTDFRFLKSTLTDHAGVHEQARRGG